MPSFFYSQVIKFDEFDVEIFAIDTSYEDSNSGRHGGICKQELCQERFKVVPQQDCLDFFNKLWNEEWSWFEKAVAASTARWKIVMGHHKPLATAGAKLKPLAKKYNVQLVLAGHTHEVSFQHQVFKDEAPATSLIVVGAGGGAQGNPGCGSFTFCGFLQDYSFADMQISKYAVRVSFYKYDQSLLHQSTIISFGQIGGEWVVGEWGPWKGLTRTRVVVCSEGKDELCPYEKKPDTSEWMETTSITTTTMPATVGPGPVPGPTPALGPTPAPTPPPGPGPPTTSLNAPAEKGATELQVEGTSGFSVGDTIAINAMEWKTIIGFGSIKIDSPLINSYPAGTAIVLAHPAPQPTPPATARSRKWLVALVAVGAVILVCAVAGGIYAKSSSNVVGRLSQRVSSHRPEQWHQMALRLERESIKP